MLKVDGRRQCGWCCGYSSVWCRVQVGGNLVMQARSVLNFPGDDHACNEVVGGGRDGSELLGEFNDFSVDKLDFGLGLTF